MSDLNIAEQRQLVAHLVHRVMGLLRASPADFSNEIVAALNLQSNNLAPNDATELIVRHVHDTVNDQNDVTRCTIENWLLAQDSADGPWTGGTNKKTQTRRKRIYELLTLSAQQCEILDNNFPAFVNMVADHGPDWVDWYTAERKQSSAYFSTSVLNYLRDTKGWSLANLNKLDRETDNIIGEIADPRWAAPGVNPPRIYASRGLVVGYVQSGKTTTMNLTIAKAIDCGYKLIIVLAGLTDLLRTQTQRRLDKEVIGQKILRDDPAEGAEPNANGEGGGYLHAKDWDEFIVHPEPAAGQQRRFVERLTTLTHDYSKPRGQQAFPEAYLADPESCKTIVIKKNVSRIKNLVKQIAKIPEEHRKRLSVLVIDDESDQVAAINLVKPDAEGNQDLAGVNEQMTELVKLLNNLQYVGLTATPFANCFVAPENEWGFYPKDFIQVLERPHGYMGILDFHDIDEVDLSPLPPDQPQPKKKKHVRDIRSPRGNDNAELRNCLDTFLLTGALKLYRARKQPGYKATTHHTFLYSDSTKQKDHEQVRDRILGLWAASGYESIAGLQRLKTLYEHDLLVNSDHQGDENYFPKQFSDLHDDISEAIRRIDEQFDGNHVVLIVNSKENVGTKPDFQECSIWKIIVGGQKLSRGYTIEGLTTTYFRRATLVESPLMQMGRWFGYRGGYQDLVRLYISRNERIGKEIIDVYGIYETTCIDEEKSRRNFIQWFNTEQPDGRRLTPTEIRPMIEISDSRLKPVKNNEKWRAKLVSATTDRWSVEQYTVDNEALVHNLGLWANALKKHNLVKRQMVSEHQAYFTEFIPHAVVSELLSGLRHSKDDKKNPWPKRAQFNAFLNGDKCQVKEWLIVLPQNQKQLLPWALPDLPSLSRWERSWRPGMPNTVSAIADSPERDTAWALVRNEQEGNPARNRLKDLPPEIQAMSRDFLGVIILKPIAIDGEANLVPVMGHSIYLCKHKICYAFQVDDHNANRMNPIQ